MKILQVIPSVAPSYGGPSHLIRVFFKLLNEVPSCSTDIVATSNDDEEISDLPCSQEKAMALSKSLLYLFDKQRSGSSWCYSKTLREWLTLNIAQYDVVHIHGLFTYPGLIASRLCRKHAIPYCVSPMGMLDPWPFRHKYLKKRLFYEFFEKQTLKNAAVIHATALPEKNSVIGFLPSATVDIVPLSVELPSIRAIAPSGNQAIELLFMSRLDEKKGLPVLFQAVALLESSGVSVRLKVAGSGEAQYTSFLRQKVKEHGIENQVEFLGFTEGEQKAQNFANSHIFVLPSYHENFGIVVAEALSYGLPVITTDRVALSFDIVEHNAGSRIPVDDPQSLASAIKQLSIRSAWDVCSVNARELSESHYSHSSLLSGLMSMYQHAHSGLNADKALRT